MSDLEAPITNSGGRNARPYDGQVNPFGRGGVYPRPQRTVFSANPCIGIAQFRFQYVALDVAFDAEITFHGEKGETEIRWHRA